LLILYFYTIYLENIKKLIAVRKKSLHSQNNKKPYLSKDLSILKYSVPGFIEGIKS
jgi:hypothetical protein